MKPISDDRKSWAHIVCVNWTPDIWFTNKKFGKIEGEI